MMDAIYQTASVPADSVGAVLAGIAVIIIIVFAVVYFCMPRDCFFDQED